jgi:hypothetical protein
MAEAKTQHGDASVEDDSSQQPLVISPAFSAWQNDVAGSHIISNALARSNFTRAIGQE